MTTTVAPPRATSGAQSNPFLTHPHPSLSSFASPALVPHPRRTTLSLLTPCPALPFRLAYSLIPPFGRPLRPEAEVEASDLVGKIREGIFRFKMHRGSSSVAR